MIKGLIWAIDKEWDRLVYEVCITLKENARVNIKDVALEAGVSYAAVSAVLSGKVGKNIRVSEATQKRIRDAAEKLQYTPNLSARSLAQGKTDIISVFTYESIFPFSSDNEFYPFLLGIEQEAELQGLDLLMITNKNHRKKEPSGSSKEVSRLRIADGGILLGIRRDNDIVARLILDKFPLVIIGRRDFDELKPYYVTYDYDSIIREHVLYARSKGHKNLVYFRSPEHYEMCEDRESALRKSCEEVGDMVVEVLYKEISHLTPVLLQSLIRRGHTLFIAEGVDYAEALQKAADILNIVIGRDLSATFFSEAWYPMDLSWTCWNDVRHLLGIEAVRLLTKIISGENPSSPILIKPNLIEGSTIIDLS